MISTATTRNTIGKLTPRGFGRIAVLAEYRSDDCETLAEARAEARRAGWVVSADDPKHYGDGGELIYEADAAALRRLERRVK
jgi:hypothetical protein